jgi:hypothetical protein
VAISETDLTFFFFDLGAGVASPVSKRSGKFAEVAS